MPSFFGMNCWANCIIGFGCSGCWPVCDFGAKICWANCSSGLLSVAAGVVVEVGGDAPGGVVEGCVLAGCIPTGGGLATTDGKYIG